LPQYTLQVGSGDVAGVVARFENSAGTCDINPLTSSLTCSSDMRLKKNITDIANGNTWSFNGNITADNQSALSRILALTPVSYNWNAESQNEAKHPGFIAQEVRQVFPDLVATDPDTGLLSLNYTGLIPYTVQAIKEINLNITDISNLNRDNTWRNALIAWFGNTSNGITDFFSKKITTDQLCVRDNAGTTCLTRSQVNQLMQGNNNGGSTTVVNPPAPDPADDTQTPEVTPPDVTDPIPDETPAEDTETPDNTAPTE
jgi:hypothetical protein